jgi:hypothetical protein
MFLFAWDSEFGLSPRPDEMRECAATPLLTECRVKGCLALFWMVRPSKQVRLFAGGLRR